ncbi:MAG: chloride channel protein [Lachnospiraceae bacterium]|nr:chloride channel protein [Lachnospiraceae bacterium]
MKEKTGNTIKLIALTALLGAFAGAVIWIFLRLAGICTGLIWEGIPEMTGFSFMPAFFATAGGLLVGVLHKRFGDYPEELDTVMARIRKDKYYDYHPVPVMLACAFIPLISGASVGPEAGLTGIIAALCYWIGDNVTFAKKNTELFSEIGEAVTLSQLFHSPLFGIIAVEEAEEDGKEDGLKLSSGNKLLFYGISTAVGFIAALALSRIFGSAMEGMPSFSEAAMGKTDLLMLLAYIPAGLLLYLLFELCEKLTRALAGRIPGVLRETVCGAFAGLVGVLLPLAMFSGEEQMGELIGSFASYSPLFLLGVCAVKLFMTAFCIRLGMKGGHFFPLIFACCCMGFALSGFFFPTDPGSHAAVAAAAVAGTVLGAQLKKPIVASLLLLLCFPAKILFLIFLCAAVGKSAAEAVERRAGAGKKEAA